MPYLFIAITLVSLLLIIVFNKPLKAVITSLCNITEHIAQGLLSGSSILIIAVHRFATKDEFPGAWRLVLGVFGIIVSVLVAIGTNLMIEGFLPYVFEEPSSKIALAITLLGSFIGILMHVLPLTGRIIAGILATLLIATTSLLAYMQKSTFAVSDEIMLEPVLAAFIVGLLGLVEIVAVAGTLHLLHPGGLTLPIYVLIAPVGFIYATCWIIIRASLTQKIKEVLLSLVLLLGTVPDLKHQRYIRRREILDERRRDYLERADEQEQALEATARYEVRKTIYEGRRHKVRRSINVILPKVLKEVKQDDQEAKAIAKNITKAIRLSFDDSVDTPLVTNNRPKDLTY